MSRNAPSMPHMSSARQTKWKSVILICMLAIVIIVIALVEVHIRRVTNHSMLLGCQNGLPAPAALLVARRE